jgi:Glycosyltransferase sugar-binding region containing DXD motif/Alpha 1,4-glycosyltransferase conserved region
VYEELSLLSFVRCGHKVEVYSYSLLDVPSGVQLCDAAAILPQSQVFSYSHGFAKGSFAAFSNLFRYKLLYEKGGIWSDSDMLCLRPLDALPDACIGREDDEFLNGAFMKFPARHLLCKRLCETAEALGKDIRQSQAGPELLTKMVTHNQGEFACVTMPVSAFYPVHWREAFKLIRPKELTYCEIQTGTSYCVHWWNTALRLIGLPKKALPPKGSFLYERAKAIFGNSKLKAWASEDVEIWIANFEKSRKGQ